MLKKICQSICLVGFLFFTGCSSFANTGLPYQIEGKMVLDESYDYENAGFEFSFFNRSEKSISSFTLVFFVFDEDGNPPMAGQNNIVLQVNEEVGALSEVEMCISLDKYFSYIPQEPYTVDYLYISKIVYSDNSVWSDPFGLGGL